MFLKPVVRRLLFAVVLCGLGACTSKQATTAFNGAAANEEFSENLVEISEMLKKVEVVCRSGEDCAENVAMMIELQTVASVVNSNRCTATLIGRDLMVTNAHCIPEKLRESNASCKGKLWFAFPQTGTSTAEVAECSYIYSANALSSRDRSVQMREIDYTLIRLVVPSKRNPMGFDQNGLLDKQELSYYRIDSSLDNPLRGVMRKASCKVSYGTSVIPTFTHPQRPIATFEDCGDIKSGNHGAPMVDSNGNMRAMLNGNHIDLSGAFKSTMLATNMACIPVPREFGGRAIRSAECDILPNSRPNTDPQMEVPEEEWKRFKSVMAERVVLWSKSLEIDEFEWTIDFVDSKDYPQLYRYLSDNSVNMNPKKVFMIAKPKCFTDPDTWHDKPVFGYRKYLLPFIAWEVRVGRDSSDKPVLTTDSRTHSIGTSVQYSYSHLRKKNWARVYFEAENPDSRMDELKLRDDWKNIARCNKPTEE